jgi:prevent-host-death family protein
MDTLPRLTPEQRDYANRRDLRLAAATLIAHDGPGVSRRRIADHARIHHSALDRLYASNSDLLAEVIGEHLHSLNSRICEIFDKAAPFGPLLRLESVIESWLGYVSRNLNFHRTALTATYLLPERERTSLRITENVLMMTIRDALFGAVPELENQPAEAVAPVLETARALLNHLPWPDPPWVKEIGAAARRIAGVLLAASRALCSGAWPDLGPVRGVEGTRTLLECAEARRQMRAVLDLVAEGGEVTLTRRGRRVAKVVAAS